MSIEDAYQKLAQAVVSFCDDSDWDSAGGRTSIFDRMTQSSYWRMQGEETVENDRFPPLDIGIEASKAALFIRDGLLKTTGHRIWGFQFTLYPNGKFSIQCDYEEPEGYIETDELISGEEINHSLGQPKS